MRAAAEVGEAAVLVERDRVAGLGELLDEVDLHEVALRGVLGEPLVARLFHAHEGLVARDDLGHARLDCGEVGFGERGLAVDIVEEAVVGGGAVAELGLGKEFEDRGRHHMRGGVAQHLQRGLVGLLQQPQLHVFVAAAPRGPPGECRRRPRRPRRTSRLRSPNWRRTQIGCPIRDRFTVTSGIRGSQVSILRPGWNTPAAGCAR